MIHLNYKRFGQMTEMRSCPRVDVKTNIRTLRQTPHRLDNSSLDLSILLLYLVFLLVSAPATVCHAKPFYLRQHYLFRRTSTSVSIKSFDITLNHLRHFCVLSTISVSWLNHSTLHWTICVWRKPFVNVSVNFNFTQIISHMAYWWITI